MEVGCGIYQMAGLTVHDKCWFDWWQDGYLKMASSSLDGHVKMGLVSKPSRNGQMHLVLKGSVTEKEMKYS